MADGSADLDLIAIFEAFSDKIVIEEKRTQDRASVRSLMARKTGLKSDMQALCAAEPERLEWPEWWFDVVSSVDHLAIRRMWSTLVLALINDAKNENIGVIVAGKTAARSRSEAITWLTGRSKDRAIVLTCCGVDVDAFNHRMDAMFKAPDTTDTNDGNK